jgi:hypothetical protein
MSRMVRRGLAVTVSKSDGFMDLRQNDGMAKPLT